MSKHVILFFCTCFCTSINKPFKLCNMLDTQDKNVYITKYSNEKHTLLRSIEKLHKSILGISRNLKYVK